VSPEVAWEYEKRLSPQLIPYTHNTGPLLTKVGVAQFEYQAQTAEDFTKRYDGTRVPISSSRDADTFLAIRKEPILYRSRKMDEYTSRSCTEYGRQSLGIGLSESCISVSGMGHRSCF
jgi:hypothetical protein